MAPAYTIHYMSHTIIYWTEQQWSEVWVSVLLMVLVITLLIEGHLGLSKPNNSSLLFLGISISPSRKRSGRESSLGWVKTLQFPSFILKAKEHSCLFLFAQKVICLLFLKKTQDTELGRWEGIEQGWTVILNKVSKICFKKHIQLIFIMKFVNCMIKDVAWRNLEIHEEMS